MQKEDLNKRKVDFTLNPDDPHIGWMAPDGSFYYTTSMEHLSFAREVAKFLYINDNDRGDECLYANGWLAVHPFGFGGSDYLFSWRGHLTEEQKRILRPFVETYGEWVAKLTKRDLFHELDIEMEDEKYPPHYMKE